MLVTSYELAPASVARYIKDQEQHHRKRTFIDEYAKLMKAHGLEWDEQHFEAD